MRCYRNGINAMIQNASGEQKTVFRIIRKIKKIIKGKVFTVLNLMMSIFKKVDEKQVLFVSDVRKDIGGNMEFVRDHLPDDFKPIYDFKEDRRDKRGSHQFVDLVRKMTTSGYIILEDYFTYTNYLRVRKGQQICQLWHGAGAFKKFGFSREANTEGIKIHPGYKKYAKAIVSADAIRKDYAEAFRISIDKVQATGIPRTDIFFDAKYIKDVREGIYEDYPLLKQRKVILFAPTYRGIRAGDAEYDFQMIDPDKMYEALGDEYVFVFKWHPATYNNLIREEKEAYNLDKYKNFFLDLSQARDINDLLLITDIMITDYSSVVFDYLLVNKPIVYYAYDLEDYEGGRGLYYDYEEYIYGPVARTQEELIEAIKKEDLCPDLREPFRKKFMEACDGRATEKTCEWLFDLKSTE